jgi:LPXTG-motif cell wall-anchored protein
MTEWRLPQVILRATPGRTEGFSTMGSYTRRMLAVLSIAVLGSAIAFGAVASAQVYPPVTTTAPPTTTTPPTTAPPTTAPPTTTTPPTTTVPGTFNVPPNVVVGGTIAVSGSACGANQTVVITFNGVQVATTTTDANGNFSTSFNVPAGTAPGSYTVTASNSICVLSKTVTVDPVAAAKLAFTGSSSSIPSLWVGAGLVALGAALVFVARRRLSGAAR